MIYHDGGFFTFGGQIQRTYTNGNSNMFNFNLVFRFDEKTKVWTSIGPLNSNKSQPGVVYDGTHFLIFGGVKDGRRNIKVYHPERCKLEMSNSIGEKIKCEDLSMVDFSSKTMIYAYGDTLPK